MTGGKHAAFNIGDNLKSDDRLLANIKSNNTLSTHVIDAYVPSGTNKFTVREIAGFKIGDVIELQRPVTKEWLHFMEMDNLSRNGTPQIWLTKNQPLTMQRRIVAIKDKEITIDVPVSDSFRAEHVAPNGVRVVKVPASDRVTQSGIENLHVQCPPLEIPFTQAPYSGVRLSADDCWVKDVFFEETMNTTAILGNRNTIQGVVIKHTYPNLGAAKPADFSFEGAQNLVDRCESTGGNTYFVWTYRITAGPNVVLNSIFRGHGSRLQPHQRWSTGLLFDNCILLEGGIDFPNRGVAGTGHGWTMGWGVAWNNIAKTYIIQNPPGAPNWAIGNIGERMKTARLFDNSPILEEGIFDSHGSPVAPRSLYLAQLADRRGPQALKNLGYGENLDRLLSKEHVKLLPALYTEVDPLLGENLALHRPVAVSNMRGNTREFSGERALDGNPNTYWATDDSIRTATMELDMENPVAVNAVELGEVTNLGARILEYKVEGQVNSDWKLLAQGSTVGDRKVHRFPTESVWKVKITLVKSNAAPALNKVGLYLTKQ
jgi:hypothetical protein